MVNSWITAIKEFNQDKKYSVPKKGTPDYESVKLIQQKNKEMVSSVPVKEPVKKPVKPVKPVKGDGIKEVV
jgi:hypothetical protein